MENVKRPFFKKWWFWAIVAVFTVNIFNSHGETKARPATVNEKPEAVQIQPDTQNEPTEANWKVTASEFGAIQTGMTYRQVVETAGMLGQLVSEAGEKGTAAYTTIFKFDGEGSPGANAVVTFQGGKVIAKAQFGLE